MQVLTTVGLWISSSTQTEIKLNSDNPESLEISLLETHYKDSVYKKSYEFPPSLSINI